MLRRLNPEYDNEIIIGRIKRVRYYKKGVVSLFIRENYDDFRKGIKPKHVYVAAFEDNWKTAQTLKDIESKLSTGLIGVDICMGIRCKENDKGQVSRSINWFKIIKLPEKIETL